MKRKRKLTGIIKYTTAKNYITKVKKMRSRKDAVDQLVADFDVALEAVIDEAKALATAEDRTTIMKPDMVAAIEKYLQRKDLPWDETAKQVIKHNPTDLGNISAEIRRWIREQEEEEKAVTK